MATATCPECDAGVDVDEVDESFEAPGNRDFHGRVLSVQAREGTPPRPPQLATAGRPHGAFKGH
jgi:hypothetical protein